MATGREQVVIAAYDYGHDYGDLDIERPIIERAGFEPISARCKTMAWR